MITTITADQIEQVIQDGQFKYLKLTGSDGKEYGGWNATPQALKKKISSVREHVSKLPPGQYFLHFRISPGKTEWKYILNRGGENTGGLSASPVIITQPVTELEKFQTLEEWKRQEQRIKDLEKQVEIMQLENQYKAQLSEKPQETPVQGFAEKILPTFLPLVDRYFDLEEKKLQSTQKQQTHTRTMVPGSTVKRNPFRPAPVPGSELWPKYLEYIDQLNDTAFTRELVYLKHNQPDVYSAVLDEDTETEETDSNEE